MSDGVIASAQGLLEGSSVTALRRVLLSVLLSRRVFSPLTAWALAKPEELEPEFDSAAVLELTLDVSICKPRLGDLPLPTISSSTQPAGVGGTGPSDDIGPGLLVGGETTRSVDRLILCDREDGGGGPGGGGGSGIPGSHLDVDEPRERDDEGVLMAPVDAALREAGGRDSATIEPSSSDDGASIEIGTGRREPEAWSLLISGESLGASCCGACAGLLENEDILNKCGVLSLDPARCRVFGGGGNVGFAAGSGEDR